MECVAFSQEAEIARHYWSDRVVAGEMTQHSESRYARVLEAFLRYATARGALRVGDITEGICRDFVFAGRSNGLGPAAATSRFRLTVVRDAYVAWLRDSLITHDPAAGLSVRQPPQLRRPMPLTPSEFARLRASGRVSPRDRVRPAAIELANAGGSHEEIARVVVTNIDATNGRVLLGSRWADLDGFAIATLTARVAGCKLTARRHQTAWDPTIVSVAMHRPLSTYPRTSIAPGISSSLGRGMQAAGLSRPGLRPASVREYAANRVYAQTGRIEEVAEFLGLASLDHAMGFIDQAWQDRHGGEVRAA